MHRPVASKEDIPYLFLPPWTILLDVPPRVPETTSDVAPVSSDVFSPLYLDSPRSSGIRVAACPREGRCMRNLLSLLSPVSPLDDLGRTPP